ncbi:amidohydrolase family protein [Paraburkholderia humisilvae]|uniref:4-sulfomuconolactone hydrolase n=1 Tax=Paraburkholderia humisilvae TaxID=627669 RepID=A0A6J5E8N0_9BURK|nr:amidohydrolase family protein [Paraburkholderia humisilvae]CAB3762197.1 4-sulfomuconolactone hydrolase [Paraburkholderia humisilvae]
MTAANSNRDAPLCLAPPAQQSGPTAFTMPAGAVDTHAHVIGEPPLYPWMPDRAYTPVPAPADAYLRMLDDTGSTYGVLVQVSVHGQDNTLMLETLRANRARLKGVVVPTLRLADAAYQAMVDAGAVGMRINVLFGGGGITFAQLDDYDALARDWGWHIQFLLDARDLPELGPRLSKLRSPIVVDHMGHLPISAGVRSNGFQRLVGLVRDGAWVKLSGAYRLSAEAPLYQDTIGYAQALADAAPTRCVWGSDWPHVAQWNTMPTVSQLLDTLALWVPDAVLRNQILTTNAHTLYGFQP